MPPKTITLPTLSFEIITWIAEYLNSQQLSTLSRCNKTLYQLQYMDILWKRFCRMEFGITYNHPDQTYRELFITCCKIKRGHGGRLPCSHLSDDVDVDRMDIVQKEEAVIQCQKCPKEGVENLYICISPNCHQTLCDRHARQHARFSSQQNHSLFYKMNTSELFCQICVDWIGGIESDPAEQYLASKITDQWINQLYTHKSIPSLLKIRQLRQIERKLRWKDTPQYIMKNGFCFISSNWMAEWEMFVEGWKTDPPFSSVIDQTQLLNSVVSLNRVGTNPFYLNSNDQVMIISSQTWDYISIQYRVKGKKIIEEDLKPIEEFYSIIKRIEYWKKRASDFGEVVH